MSLIKKFLNRKKVNELDQLRAENEDLKAKLKDIADNFESWYTTSASELDKEDEKPESIKDFA